MPKDGAMTLRDAEAKGTRLEITCERCDRRGSYAIAGLVRRHGWAAKLPDVLAVLTSDCERRMADGRCNAVFGRPVVG